MSDEMLAEGKGGFFILDDSTPYWMQKSGSNRSTYGGSMLEIFYIIQAAEQLGFSDGLEGFLGPYYSLREAAADCSRKRGIHNSQVFGNHPSFSARSSPSNFASRFGNYQGGSGFGGRFP